MWEWRPCHCRLNRSPVNCDGCGWVEGILSGSLVGAIAHRTLAQPTGERRRGRSGKPGRESQRRKNRGSQQNRLIALRHRPQRTAITVPPSVFFRYATLLCRAVFPREQKRWVTAAKLQFQCWIHVTTVNSQRQQCQYASVFYSFSL